MVKKTRYVFEGRAAHSLQYIGVALNASSVNLHHPAHASGIADQDEIGFSSPTSELTFDPPVAGESARQAQDRRSTVGADTFLRCLISESLRSQSLL